MKNKLIMILLSLVGVAQAADVLTNIENDTDARIFYTWKSTNSVVKKIRGSVKSDYTSIDAGKARKDNHLNDLLVVYYPVCKSGKPEMVQIEYNAKANGYGKDGLRIVTQGNGTASIEKID